MSQRRASALWQLLNWDAPGRRRNHIHQINCWTLSTFLSEPSYEKHEEKETWEGRRTWERTRCITHCSGTCSPFLSSASEAVWAGGAPGLQLVMQWEPSSEHRAGSGGARADTGREPPDTNPSLGVRECAQGPGADSQRKLQSPDGCRVSLGPLRHPWAPVPPSLLPAVLGRRRLVLWDSPHSEPQWGPGGVRQPPGEVEVYWWGGSFWCRTGQIPPSFFLFIFTGSMWHWENFTLGPSKSQKSLQHLLCLNSLK